MGVERESREIEAHDSPRARAGELRSRNSEERRKRVKKLESAQRGEETNHREGRKEEIKAPDSLCMKERNKGRGEKRRDSEGAGRGSVRGKARREGI